MSDTDQIEFRPWPGDAEMARRKWWQKEGSPRLFVFDLRENKLVTDYQPFNDTPPKGFLNVVDGSSWRTKNWRPANEHNEPQPWDEEKSSPASAVAAPDTSFREGLPTVEQVRRHLELYGGRWEDRGTGSSDEGVFFTVHADGLILGDFWGKRHRPGVHSPSGLWQTDSYRPVKEDKTPVPWSELEVAPQFDWGPRPSDEELLAVHHWWRLLERGAASEIFHFKEVDGELRYQIGPVRGDAFNNAYTKHKNDRNRRVANPTYQWAPCDAAGNPIPRASLELNRELHQAHVVQPTSESRPLQVGDVVVCQRFTDRDFCFVSSMEKHVGQAGVIVSIHADKIRVRHGQEEWNWAPEAVSLYALPKAEPKTKETNMTDKAVTNPKPEEAKPSRNRRAIDVALFRSPVEWSVDELHGLIMQLVYQDTESMPEAQREGARSWTEEKLRSEYGRALLAIVAGNIAPVLAPYLGKGEALADKVADIALEYGYTTGFKKAGGAIVKILGAKIVQEVRGIFEKLFESVEKAEHVRKLGAAQTAADLFQNLTADTPECVQKRD